MAKSLSSALLDACNQGDTYTVKNLLDGGLDVNTVDENGDFPLLRAVSFGNLKVVRLLLERGANVELLNSLKESPLYEGEYDDWEKIHLLLKQHGAKDNIMRVKRKATQLVQSEKQLGDIESDSEVTLSKLYPSLLDACGRGDLDTVDYLLDQGLDVNHIDEEGKSALQMACSYGHVEVIKCLLKRGATTSHLSSIDFKGATESWDEVYALLRDHGANQDVMKRKTTSDASVSLGSCTLMDLERGKPPMHTIFRELLPVASKWMNIGIMLRMEPETLDTIKYDNNYSCRECLREMLRKWLKEPQSTWIKLIEATEDIDPYVSHRLRECIGLDV